MIPKIIHYCWFGRNPLPPLAEKCIASWRKFLPDYEIWEWSETTYENETSLGDYETLRYEDININVNANANDNPNFNDNEGLLYDKKLFFDVNMIPYTAEAYRLKKYAFVSDFARFWILYRYGGLYFDTDVEVIRPMEDIIERGNFMGFETDPDGENSPQKYAPKYSFGVNPGVGFGMRAHHPFLERMVELYKDLTFDGGHMNPWLKTIVAFSTEALIVDGLENAGGIQQIGDITIYPSEYFAPINVITGRLHVTANTRTIHRYMGSWNGKKSFKEKFRSFMPEFLFLMINKMKRRKYRIG